jgi:hypothetical protein
MLRSEVRTPDYEAGLLTTSQGCSVQDRDKELTIIHKKLRILLTLAGKHTNW